MTLNRLQSLALGMLVTCCALTCAAQPKIKTLVITGGHGFEQESFFKIFSDNPELEVTRAAHESPANASAYDREDFLAHDVVVLYDMPKGLSDRQRQNFLSLFDKGVGLVVLHHAICSFQDWPEYEQIIGGRYAEPDPARPGRVTEAVGWQHDVEVPVVIANHDHPITAGLSDFTLRDEIYWGFRVGRDVTPLLTTTHPKSGKPLAWARSQGKSRVVYIQSGHGRETFENPNYQKLLARSIRWTAQKNGAATTVAVPPRVFLLDGTHLVSVRQRLAAGDPALKDAYQALLDDANELLDARLVSVVDKKLVPPSGDKHDYMSQAPYFWPDPKSSNGLPYIRRDGERNPEINRSSDHGNILGMPDKAQTLALAWYFSSDERYAQKAAAFLRTWFLDPATRMNPHFKYAQAIPGVNTGRGIGLIESRGLTHAVDAAGLLAGSKAWTAADQSGLQSWFREFLGWMRESPYGRDEAAAKNNHGTYYDVQVTSFALFLGDRKLATEILTQARQKRIAVQIEPDGRQPLELARTKAWGYSTGNLSGLMSLAVLGERVGVDLWHYETPDGRSIAKALDYLLPFGLEQQPWPHQQLGGWSAQGFPSLVRKGALGLGGKYVGLAAKFPALSTKDRDLLLAPQPRGTSPAAQQ